MTKHITYLAYGTNLGNKEENILEAYRLTEESVGKIILRSSLYYSKPWGFESSNDFVNSVVCCETDLTPHQLLTATQAIEKELGRSLKSVNGEYHDRIIDIDILLYDDVTINVKDLTIPHPLMQERDFVTVPLNEIRNEQLNNKTTKLNNKTTKQLNNKTTQLNNKTTKQLNNKTTTYYD